MMEKKITSKILDAELDLLECCFNNDNCVQINTKDYKHITLDIENLFKLIKMITDAEINYKL